MVAAVVVVGLVRLSHMIHEQAADVDMDVLSHLLEDMR